MGDKKPKEKWFVILQFPNGDLTPLMGVEELAIFISEEEADRAGGQNPLGKACGWKSFQFD